jgi:hypothetical protein
MIEVSLVVFFVLLLAVFSLGLVPAKFPALLSRPSKVRHQIAAQDYREELRLRKKAEHDEWYAQWTALIPRKPEPPALIWYDDCSCESVYDINLCDRWGTHTITRIAPDCKNHGHASWYAEKLVEHKAELRSWVQMNVPSLAQNPYQYPRRPAVKVHA